MTETLSAPLIETHEAGTTPLYSVSVDAIPDAALDAFLGSAKLDETATRHMGLDSLAALQHSNGDVSYIGTVLGESDEFMSEENTYVTDTDLQGSVTGIGEIRFFQSFKGMPGMVGRPFVGYNSDYRP